MTDFFAFAPPDAAWLHDFQEKLLTWFAANRRPLPWRQDYQSYHVWIAEIMLQQTQMGRAVDYFRRWIAHFPDVAAVAAAERDELLKYWEGLGYYSRLDNLHRAAHIINEQHGGALPEQLEELQKLPGVGRYTAAAIASIAFGCDVALADANVSRLFARLFDLDQPLHDGAGRRLIEGMAARLLPAGQARDYNQALMELGALICLPKKPRCQDCPLSELCLARQRNTVAKRPSPRRAAMKRDLPMAAVVLVDNDGRVLIRRRSTKGMWAGLWEFPSLVLQPGDEPVAALRRELPHLAELATPWAKLGRIGHHHTKYRVRLDSYLCRLSSDTAATLPDVAGQCHWVRLEELTSYTFSVGHRRLAGLIPPFIPPLAATT